MRQVQPGGSVILLLFVALVIFWVSVICLVVNYWPSNTVEHVQIIGQDAQSLEYYIHDVNSGECVSLQM